ncbi:MAG TPA: hypothetical protein VGE07_29350 [Herpetosiphonaceae bacterium]
MHESRRAQRWPLWAAIGLLLSLVAAMLAVGLARTGGRLIYPLDDTYIHMAVARSLGYHGVWGLTRFSFSTSSSSLLWTLVLAAAQRVTLAEWLPLALNLAAALGLLAGADRMLVADGWSPRWRAGALAALILITPLALTVTLGMEHTLHVALTIWLARLASLDLTGERAVPLWQILLLAALNSMIRYEGLFLSAAIGLAYLLQRRWGRMALIGAAAALPVVVFGLISVSNGWPFLPATLIYKTDLFETSRFALIPSFANFVPRAVGCFLTSGLALGLMLGFDRASIRRQPVMFHALALGTLVLHVMYARTGWLHRYEAYLIAVNTLALLGTGRLLAPHLLRSARRRWLIAALGFGLAAYAGLSIMGMGQIHEAMEDIYRQHYQMARFATDYFQQGAIGLNDIGAVAYYTDRPILDFIGLASRETLAARRLNTASPEVFGQLAERSGVRLVMVYDTWMGRYLPPAWPKIGTMSLDYKTIADSFTVSVYATREEDVPKLAAAWRAFAPTLPPAVHAEVLR